jgi:hypothetical protein
MKKLVAVTVGALTIALLALSLVPASSQPAGRRVTIQLFDPDKTGFSHDINEDGQGFGAGDWSVAIDQILNADTCDKAGSLYSRFVAIKRLGQRNGAFIADGSLRLPGGNLVVYVRGTFSSFGKGVTGAVIGGTDSYLDATGEFSGRETRHCGQRGFLFRFDLSV